MSGARFGFGEVLRCKLTGIKGTVLCILYYSTGCIHYMLSPQGLNKEGNMREYLYLDEDRLERTGKTIDIGQYTHGKGGSSEEKRSGPMAAPCRRQGKL